MGSINALRANTSALCRVLCFVWILSGCATHPSHPMDPLEPMNRAIYQFNEATDRAIAKPAAQAYQFVVPSPVRSAIGNFFGNIADAYSAINNALRADPVKTLNDIMRVALNSTFGLFGLIDIATPAGLKKNNTSFGDTLATWGWKSSDYLVLPLLGPSTIRDGLGLGATLSVAFDRQLYGSPAHANVAWGLYLLDKRERLLGLEDAVYDAALDPYAYTRDAYLQARTKQTGGVLPDNADDELTIDEIMGEVATEAQPAAPLVSPLENNTQTHD